MAMYIKYKGFLLWSFKCMSHCEPLISRSFWWICLCSILICMQKHIQHNKDERTQFFRKIYHSLYSKGLRKGYRERGELETEQRLPHIDLHSSGHSSISFPFSWAAQFGARWPSFCWVWFSLLELELWSPTDWLPVASGLYNYLTYNWFLGRHNSHSIQPVDSQGYPRYLRPDAPVIYTGAFLIWQLGRVGGQYVTLVQICVHVALFDPRERADSDFSWFWLGRKTANFTVLSAGQLLQ